MATPRYDLLTDLHVISTRIPNVVKLKQYHGNKGFPSIISTYRSDTLPSVVLLLSVSPHKNWRLPIGAVWDTGGVIAHEFGCGNNSKKTLVTYNKPVCTACSTSTWMHFTVPDDVFPNCAIVLKTPCAPDEVCTEYVCNMHRQRLGCSAFLPLSIRIKPHRHCHRTCSRYISAIGI